METIFWSTYHKSNLELVGQQKMVEGTAVKGLIVEETLVKRSASQKTVA